jgi:carbonic anhydrase
MVIDEILEHNERFVQQTTLPIIGHAPARHLAVITCMDCRLVQMFEAALGLERGDVLELRTAGATIPENQRAMLTTTSFARSRAVSTCSACAKSPSSVIRNAASPMSMQVL